MNKKLIIACDVDDCLAAFTPHAHKFYEKEMEKCHYWCTHTMDAKFGKDWFNKIAPVEEFWKTLPRLSDPKDIDFEISYYISAFPQEMYQLRVDWLKEHGFPDAPLVVSMNKVETCKELGVDVLIDDKPQTIISLQGTGITGIHFMTEYAGFDPVGNYITNLNQVNEVLELAHRYERS